MEDRASNRVVNDRVCHRPRVVEDRTHRPQPVRHVPVDIPARVLASDHVNVAVEVEDGVEVLGVERFAFQSAELLAERWWVGYVDLRSPVSTSEVEC